jgi:hypothetical protein
MFRPVGYPEGRRDVRIAFAYADRCGISTLFERLVSVTP